ncbi:MAG: UDP-N-acetylmuramate dehydrogenase [Treponema sp.]|jgi:UDP-N-acetylmuramate dehydrogenase|nr:UDP-N-acetylmuramate dehydrogenase [Treponema sp.]
MSKTGADKIHQIIDKCRRNCRCEVDIRYDESMQDHTTFKVGGPADFWVRPLGEGFPEFSSVLLRLAKEAAVPVFILGGGANIVVSDKGIRGIVLDTGGWKGCGVIDEGLIFKSGTTMDEAADCAADLSFSGLEFLAGMPGTIGGAVWMNARCYGKEIADVLTWTEVIDFGAAAEPEKKRLPADKADFGYKLSPFQGKDFLILNAAFKLDKSDKTKILNEMKKNRNDRKEKGHYSFPCAGSAFKNNRRIGKPTGQIIDELGLKGFSKGGAQIAPFHGNIVINTGGAAAADIRALIDIVAAEVKKKTGFVLEPEILFVGE